MFLQQDDQYALLYIILHLLSSFDTLLHWDFISQFREQNMNIEIPGFGPSFHHCGIFCSNMSSLKINEDSTVHYYQ